MSYLNRHEIVDVLSEYIKRQKIVGLWVQQNTRSMTFDNVTSKIRNFHKIYVDGDNFELLDESDLILQKNLEICGFEYTLYVTPVKTNFAINVNLLFFRDHEDNIHFYPKHGIHDHAVVDLAKNNALTFEDIDLYYAL